MPARPSRYWPRRLGPTAERLLTVFETREETSGLTDSIVLPAWHTDRANVCQRFQYIGNCKLKKIYVKYNKIFMYMYIMIKSNEGGYVFNTPRKPFERRFKTSSTKLTGLCSEFSCMIAPWLEHARHHLMPAQPVCGWQPWLHNILIVPGEAHKGLFIQQY